jgi:outer membrane protein assembly factor BamB
VNTGKVRWETNVRGAAAKYFFHGDVFIARDRIVASADVDTSGGAEAGVHAFDRTSGRELWKHPAGRGVPGAVTGNERLAFSYTARGELIALDLDTGKLAWSRSIGASGWESPAVEGARVFAGSETAVVAVSTETGRIEWERKLAAPVSSSIRVRDSNVYAGTADGSLHRLSASTGEVRSSLKLDAALKAASAPLVTSDAVFTLLADQQQDYRALVSADGTLGRINWRQRAPDRWTTSRVFVTGGMVLVGAPSGEVSAYCARDGSPAWTSKVSSAAIRSIGGTQERLFVGTPEGTLYAIRPPRACR